MSRALFCSFTWPKLCYDVARKVDGKRVSASVIHSVSKSTRCGDLGHTIILLEDGFNIRELPIIVRKVSSNSIIFCENKGVVNNPTNTRGSEITVADDIESKEIIDYFNKCYTARGIFAILETIPSNEVTAVVALYALKRIVTLENNKTIRNSSLGEVYQYLDQESTSADDGLHENETFTRTAVLTQLVDKILSSSDTDALLSGYVIVNRDIIGKYIKQDIKDKFINEVLCRVTDGKFTIKQTCEAIKIFSDIAPKSKETTDKLWVGISEKVNNIDQLNYMEVVRSIPFLSQSRKLVLSVIEKKLLDFWHTLNGYNVAEILVILKQINSTSPRILGVLGQWVNKNLHTATEDDLIEIINGFCSLSYNSEGIENALERYVKAKGVSIKNPLLMASIMDYCGKFRVRSPILLQGSAEYLVAHGKSLSPVLLQRLFLPIGQLNYHPSNGLTFWKTLESVLEEKFVQFRPEEAIDMLLNCVYLQKHPLNFVKKVFNPYFLDRLHSYKNKDTVSLARMKLQLLDMAMTLESTQYEGPILPRTTNSPPIWQDGRVKRMANSIRSYLSEIAGGPDKVAYNLIPGRLPSVDIYILDALILSTNDVSYKLFPINLDRDYNKHTAVIIHTPEHYCSKREHLIGKQEMRKRHLRHLGLKVVSLDVENLAKLRVHPKALSKYLEERFSQAELPFPKGKNI